jgi:hypothetical protein
VHLDPVAAVLEQVVLADRLPGELAALAHRREAGAQLERDRAAQDQAAGLDARHLVDPLLAEGLGQPLDRLPEAARIEQQGGDVAEQDSRLRVIGDGSDQRLQRHPGLFV